jgi:hypothetical protein
VSDRRPRTPRSAIASSAPSRLRYPDAAVGQDAAAGTIGAAFTLDAPDAETALEEARRLFDTALDQLGVSRGEVVELHVAKAAVASDDTPGRGGERSRNRPTLNVSRERVRQWAANPKLGFPAPVARVGRSVVWEWPPVARWAERRRAAEQPKT